MNRFIKLTTAATAALALLSAPALAASEPTVKEVNVTAQVTNLDSNAQEFYPNIAHDILTEITNIMPLTHDQQGFVIDVVVQNVSLDGNSVLPDSREFNQIEGVMSIRAQDTNANSESFPIKVVAQGAGVATPEGFAVVEPSTTDFYQALIAGFAREVAERETEVMPMASSK